MKQIRYNDRNCDLCAGSDLHEVIAYTTKARTRSDTFLWQVRNVVCRSCGFAFVSPAPTEQSLAEYYADSFPLASGGIIEFQPEKRINLLCRHIQLDSRPLFVELGGNASDAFERALHGLVGGYCGIELNKVCSRDFESLRSLRPDSVDILSAYFVFEHLSNPRPFFAMSAQSLKRNGLLVIEVPNLYIYPSNPAGIMLHEHTNHFSPRSLGAMAALEGFDLVEISHENCSRPYGFAAVFSKSAKSDRAKVVSDGLEFQIAKTCMTEGTAFIRNYRKQLEDVREKIRVAGNRQLPIVLWAANKYALDLLEGFTLPRGTVVVDSDPEKQNYLGQIPVAQPAEAEAAILAAKLFVINSSLHSNEILSWIREKKGRELLDEEVIVIEPGFEFCKVRTSPSAATVPSAKNDPDDFQN
jgi:SAM-dependent methyltransferase